MSAQFYGLCRHRYPGPERGQRGVAVITALLLTTLAVTIVASLFWQQQVQVRSIENQRMQLQKQWILRGALDWARLILTASAQAAPGVDTLQQPWAVGLAETRLDSYVENGRSDSEASDASIAGKIIDAQSRLNLRALSQAGRANPAEVEVFSRLLTALRLNPALAAAAAEGMAAGQSKSALPAGTTNPASSAGGVAAITSAVSPTSTTPTVSTATPISGSDSPHQMAISQVDDLLAVPGFSPDIVEKLRNFVIILPYTTAINVNTASAEVLYARIATLSLADATGLVAERDKIPFRDLAFLKARFPGVALDGVGIKTDYFLVDGKVRLNRAGLEVQALIWRNGGTSTVLWIREN